LENNSTHANSIQDLQQWATSPTPYFLKSQKEACKQWNSLRPNPMNKKAFSIVLCIKNQTEELDYISIEKRQTDICHQACQEKSTSGGKKVHF